MKTPSERAIGRVFMAIGRAHDNRRRDEVTLPIFPLPLILDAEGTLARDAAHLVGRCGPKRRARRSDPATSKAAALKASEFAAGHAAKILAALSEHGAGNKNDIAGWTGIDATAVARRGKELVEAGLVAMGPDSKDGCRLWRAA